jgi:hypothetical protein
LYFNKSNLRTCPETGPSPFGDFYTIVHSIVADDVTRMLSERNSKKGGQPLFLTTFLLARYLFSITVFLSLSYSRPSWLDSVFLIYYIISHRPSCPSMQRHPLKKSHRLQTQPSRNVSLLSRITDRTSSPKTTPSLASSESSQSLETLLSRISERLPQDHTSHDLTSTMLSNTSQLSEDHEGVDLNQEHSTKERKSSKRRKTLMERISPKNPELCPQKHPDLPKNTSLTKPFIRGLPQKLSQGPHCQIASNLHGSSSSTTLQTLSKPNGPCLVPSSSPISPTVNGTMSYQVNPSTSTLSSPVPYPQPLTTAPSSPLESLSFSSEPPSLLKRLQPMETGLSRGELPRERSRLLSRIESKNSIPTVTTLQDTSQPYTTASIQKSSSSTNPSANMLVPSETLNSRISTNLGTSKLDTSMSVESVQNPTLALKRKRSLSPSGEVVNPAATGIVTRAISKLPDAGIVTSAKSAKGTIAKETALIKRDERETRSRRPRYARELMWGYDEDIISPAAQYSLFADPLPRPPLSVLQNSAASKTIRDHPDLFTIICNINIDAFETLLADHPKPLFVQSVLTGLREGFWPLTDIPEFYPVTCDNPIHEPKTERERIFLRTQIAD